MPDDIRRMPAPEFERPKRRVPFKLYFAITLPLGLLWLWSEDSEINLFTATLAGCGLIYIGKGVGRLIMNERAISKELGILKRDHG